MILEYLQKGIAISLIVALAWNAVPVSGMLVWLGLAVTGWSAGALLAMANARKAGFQSNLLYAQLIRPGFNYAGLLVGMLLGCGYLIFQTQLTVMNFFIALGIGLLIGMVMIALRRIPSLLLRRGSVLLIASGVVFIVLYFVEPLLAQDATLRIYSGIQFALAALVLVILTWVGRTEETELEAGLVCLLLAIALWLLVPNLKLMALALPVMLYVYYTSFMLRQVQSYKHLLYGYVHVQQKERVASLGSFRRAVQLHPANTRAREEIWRIHRTIQLNDVHNDPRLLSMLDFDLCLNRARENLLADEVPAAKGEESLQLLHLVQDQRPHLLPEVLYWKAVAHLHGKEFDKAEAELKQVLDKQAFGPDQVASQKAITLSAWQLALLLHPEMKKRVGLPLINGGRKMEAIADVELALEASPTDEVARQLKSFLYSRITLNEYEAAAGTNPLTHATQFDHGWCWETAKELFDDATNWRKGVKFAQMALRAKPEHAPAMWNNIAEAAVKQGDAALATKAKDKLLEATLLLGVKEVSPESRELYFNLRKQRGEEAYGLGEVPMALEHLLACLEDPRSGAETTKMIADLYEHQGDVINTLLFTERGLVYDGKKPELLERKDQVYYSLTPEQLRQNKEKLGKLFDYKYCLSKATELIDLKNAGREQFEWGTHLASLASTHQPESVAGWSLQGRAQLRMGNRDAAMELLARAREAGKETKGGDSDEWYLTCRILGDLYLEQGEHQKAIDCLLDFKGSSKSGADTLFKLAKAHEAIGDSKKAINFYKHVAMYDNPVAWEAKEALQRLGASA